MNDIEKALEKDAELSEEEYNKAHEEAAKNADAHAGELPEGLTEEEKHRRIQSNFYGSQINFNLAILHTLQSIEAQLAAIAEVLNDKE